MPDVKLSQLAAASAASVAAGAGLWTMAGHILGLRMEYVGPASIRVSSGSAWIPSLQQAIEVPTALTLSGLTLAANTWHHVYLYVNGSTPAIEAVTDAPAAPYSGTARAKTGATSRRYIGSFRTNASSQILKFAQSGNAVTYLEDTNAAPFLVLAGGTASTATSVSAAAVAPPTATSIKATVLNASTNAYVRLSNSDGPNAATGYITVAAPGGVTVTEIPLNASQAYTYSYDAAPNSSTYQRVFGYVYER